jgi:S1-C subfamily serine protease
MSNGSPARRGIQVRDVTRGGPAWNGGIRPGDVLLSLDGLAIDDARGFLLLIAQRAPGTQIELEVERNGERFQTYSTLIQQPPLR